MLGNEVKLRLKALRAIDSSLSLAQAALQRKLKQWEKVKKRVEKEQEKNVDKTA